MLVTCPKCGFNQPKDTYCASCGIEMDSFKPIKPPFWKTLIKSPLIPLLIFVGLGYAAFFYLKNQSQFQFPNSNSMNYTADKLNQQTGTQPNPAPETQANPIESSQTNNLESTSTPEALPPPAPQPSTIPTDPNGTPSAAPQPQASTTPKTLNPQEDFEKTDSNNLRQDNPPIESITGPLTVEIRFVEAPQSVVQSFLSEASENSGGDTGEMSFAIVKNSSAWLNHKSFKELDRFSKNVPPVKKKLQWFSGTHEPNSGAPFGLDFQISIQERMGGHLAGDLFISRSMVEHVGKQIETQRKEFTTHFETDVGSLIGLAGIMPRVRYKSEDKDPLQDSLLKIFLSPSFLEGESDLLILLQFKGEAKPVSKAQ